MRVLRVFRKLRDDDRGAVTIDWVVLTAALCGLVLGIFDILTATVYEDAANRIESDVISAAERP